jgi:enoyl-CoA hydratase/carnithine racemase
MSSENGSRVEVTLEGAVACLAMSFRGRLNLMDARSLGAITDAVTSIRGRRGLRVAVLSGAAGRPFVGGADIRVLRDLGPGSAREFIRGLSGAFRAIRDLDIPVVAAIEGYALGGGLELAMSCDLRVASSGARLGLPEVKVGIPSVIEAALLPRLVGLGRAQRLLYTGELIDGTEAHRIGLVDVLTAPEETRSAAMREAGRIAACSPAAIRAQKRLLRTWQESHLDAAVAAGVEEFDRAYAGGDPREGMTAFLERRSPRFED